MKKYELEIDTLIERNQEIDKAYLLEFCKNKGIEFSDFSNYLFSLYAMGNVKNEIFKFDVSKEVPLLLEQKIFYYGSIDNNIHSDIWLKEAFSTNKKNINNIIKNYNLLFEKFQALKTELIIKNNELYQYININQINGIEFQTIDSITLFNFHIEKLTKQKKSVINSKLFYLTIYNFNDSDDIIVYFEINHIISDGWAINFILDILQSNHPKLKQTNNHYYQFLIDRLNFTSKKNDNDRQIKIGKTFHNLITNNDVLTGLSYREKIFLKGDKYNRIIKFCEEHRISEFSFFLSILQLSLSYVTSISDWVIGSCINGRNNLNYEDEIFCFIQFLSIELESKSNLLEMMNHADSEVKKIILNKYNTIRNDNYNVILIYHDYNTINNPEYKKINIKESEYSDGFYNFNVIKNSFDENFEIVIDFAVKRFDLELAKKVNAAFNYFGSNFMHYLCSDYKSINVEI